MQQTSTDPSESQFESHFLQENFRPPLPSFISVTFELFWTPRELSRRSLLNILDKKPKPSFWHCFLSHLEIFTLQSTRHTDSQCHDSGVGTLPISLPRKWARRGSCLVKVTELKWRNRNTPAWPFLLHLASSSRLSTSTANLPWDPS